MLLVFFPTLLYRWSLKSTFWIYLPFIWVIGPARFNQRSLWLRTQRILNDQVVLFLSAAVLMLGVIKIRLWQTRAGLAEWLDNFQLGRFFSDYIAPDNMPAWQYASMINSALAIGMYITARAALNAREEESPWPETATDAGFRVAMGARRILTLYTTFVLVIITLKQGFPPLGEFLPVWASSVLSTARTADFSLAVWQ